MAASNGHDRTDSKAGLAEANKRSTDDDSFKDTARTAGEMLMNMRQYPQAADFLEAGAAGDNAARTMGLANMLRGAQHHEDMQFANTPATRRSASGWFHGPQSDAGKLDAC